MRISSSCGGIQIGLGKVGAAQLGLRLGPAEAVGLELKPLAISELWLGLGIAEAAVLGL